MKKILFLFLITISIVVTKASAQTAGTNAKPAFSIADSASFTGKYKFEGQSFQYMEVTVRDGKLHFEGGEYNGFLDPIDGKKDSFDVGGEALFTFIRNNENKITELKIDYQDKTYVGKREEKKG